MEVILMEDIPAVGKAGEQIKVKDGYARNYLIPEQKAVLATMKNTRALEAKRKSLETKRQQSLAEAQTLAATFVDLNIQIMKPVGSQDRLFGSVTKMEIQQALKLQGKVVDKESIELAEPIKTLGDFEISVKLHPEVKTTLKITVIKK